MADPVTPIIAGIGLFASVAGAATSAYGAEYQGAAQAAQAKYQAGVADVNATLAKQDAAYAIATGEVEAQAAGMKGRAEVGTTRAAYGAGNIDVSSGSAADVTKSETALTQYNESIIRSNAAKRAYGFETTAAADTAQGGMYRSAAGTVVTAANIGATSSLLSGAGNVSDKWLQAQKAGVFSDSNTYQTNPSNPFT